MRGPAKPVRAIGYRRISRVFPVTSTGRPLPVHPRSPTSTLSAGSANTSPPSTGQNTLDIRRSTMERQCKFSHIH
ncbi:hypothetical protein B0H10DRAFT_2049977 [Mycena sp. CBHHK59/15]|nr:hypothetical protein B0H10DRAFT_2049977 [Mycena sp. CBHHK59/15]